MIHSVNKQVIDKSAIVAIRQAELKEAEPISDLVTACCRQFSLMEGYTPTLVANVISRRATQASIVELIQK